LDTRVTNMITYSEGGMIDNGGRGAIAEDTYCNQKTFFITNDFMTTKHQPMPHVCELGRLRPGKEERIWREGGKPKLETWRAPLCQI
jgi:hypothetical protein